MKIASKAAFRTLSRAAVAAAILGIPLATLAGGCGEKKDSKPAAKSDAKPAEHK